MLQPELIVPWNLYKAPEFLSLLCACDFVYVPPESELLLLHHPVRLIASPDLLFPRLLFLETPCEPKKCILDHLHKTRCSPSTKNLA